jgi:hypothetical protein
LGTLGGSSSANVDAQGAKPAAAGGATGSSDKAEQQQEQNQIGNDQKQGNSSAATAAVPIAGGLQGAESAKSKTKLAAGQAAHNLDADNKILQADQSKLAGIDSADGNLKEKKSTQKDKDLKDKSA